MGTVAIFQGHVKDLFDSCRFSGKRHVLFWADLHRILQSTCTERREVASYRVTHKYSPSTASLPSAAPALKRRHKSTALKSVHSSMLNYSATYPTAPPQRMNTSACAVLHGSNTYAWVAASPKYVAVPCFPTPTSQIHQPL